MGLDSGNSLHLSFNAVIALINDSENRSAFGNSTLVEFTIVLRHILEGEKQQFEYDFTYFEKTRAKQKSKLRKIIEVFL